MALCLHHYGGEPGSALEESRYAGTERVYTRCHRCGKIWNESKSTILASLSKIKEGK